MGDKQTLGDKVRLLLRRILGVEKDIVKQDVKFRPPLRGRLNAFMSAFGYGPIVDFLRVEDELMCLTGDTKILVLNHGVPAWVPIKTLAEEYKNKPQEPIITISFDLNLGCIVYSNAYHPRKTLEKQEIYKVKFYSNGNGNCFVKATEKHPFLVKTGEKIFKYKPLKELKIGDVLVGIGGSNKPVKEKDTITVVDITKTDETEDVYDLTVPGFENFVANGVIVHNSRYVDYEEMDESSEIIASALDIYADDSTIPDYTSGRTVMIDASDAGVKRTLDEMLNERVNIDDDIWAIARALCKYGNVFVEILFKENGGVGGVQILPPPTMRIIPNSKGDIIGYMQTFSPYRGRISEEEFQKGLENPTILQRGEVLFEPFEVAHFKLGRYKTWSLYGESILERCRWIWRRLILLEDSVLIYRLERAPSRFVFYVDVGDLPREEAIQEIYRIRNEYKRRKFVNKEGRLDFKYNPLSQMEDFFIPVRHGREGTKIDVLGGPAYSYIEDLDYFKDKLLAALKVPKAYMSYTEDVNRATLCLVSDTKIPLFGGEEKSIKQLAEEGKEFLVYSVDKDKNVVIKKATAKPTLKNAEVWEIEIDNGRKVRATPDHPFMMRDGSFKKLADLKPGESLMPFVRKPENGCEIVFNPGDGKWVLIHNNYREDVNSRENKQKASIECKVVAIRFVGYEDCYDLTVEDVHNFALSAGVFVHNSSLDVRFARTIMQIQREIRNGIKQICDAHLASFGLIPNRVDYDISLTVPSAILELAQLEIMKARADVAEALGELFPPDWILQNVFGFSEEEANKLINRVSDVETTPDRMPESFNSKNIKKILAEKVKLKDGEELNKKLERVLADNVDLKRRLDKVSMFLKEIIAVSKK